jgi:hypothetical protein
MKFVCVVKFRIKIMLQRVLQDKFQCCVMCLDLNKGH